MIDKGLGYPNKFLKLSDFGKVAREPCLSISKYVCLYKDKQNDLQDFQKDV